MIAEFRRFMFSSDGKRGVLRQMQHGFSVEGIKSTPRNSTLCILAVRDGEVGLFVADEWAKDLLKEILVGEEWTAIAGVRDGQVVEGRMVRTARKCMEMLRDKERGAAEVADEVLQVLEDALMEGHNAD